MRLPDRVATVTGGASGIGRATARLFAAEGARIVVADVNEQGERETVEAIKSAGGQAVFCQTVRGTFIPIHAANRNKCTPQARITVRDPQVGSRRGQVVIRPVRLNALVGALALPLSPSIERLRRAIAEEMAFGVG